MAEERYGGLTCADATDLASGFVLDALEPDEAAAVRVHLAACGRAHPAFEELGGVLPALLASVPIVAPPAALRGRLMDAAARERGIDPAAAREAAARERGIDSAAAREAAARERGIDPAAAREAAARERGIDSAAAQGAAAVPAGGLRSPVRAANRRDDEPAGREAGPPPPVRIDRQRASPWSAVLRLAAVLAIVALGVSNLSLQQGLHDADRYAAAVTAALDLAARPGSVAAVLAPSTPGGPTGLAAVGADGTLALAVRGLPATSGREVYEAWVIEGSAAPVPIGGFTVGSDGRGGLAIAARPAPPGSVIALTREPGPGATAPTLPIVASGAALARPG